MVMLKQSVLGVLALSLSGASALAKAPQQVECYDLLDQTQSSEVFYDHTFDLVKGEFALGLSPDLGSVKSIPANSEYAPGFSGPQGGDTSGTIAKDEVTFEYTGFMGTERHASFAMTLHFDKPIDTAQIAMISAAGQLEGRVLNYGAEAPGTYHISAVWDKVGPEVGDTPFKVGLFINKNLAVAFNFDFSKINYKKLMDAEDQKLRNATGLKIDKSTGKIKGFSECLKR
jgi:hypothetical protein